ncbi:MAG: tetratricopeptide repeat protein [Thiohalomonadales bacterium]
MKQHRIRSAASISSNGQLFALITVVVFVLAGCISTGQKNEVTLKSLNKKTTPITKEKVRKSRRARAQARITYKEFARSSRDEGLRAKAMERLADMEMESTQDEKIKEVERRERAALKEGRPVDVFQSETKDEADYAVVALQYEDILAKHSNPKKNEGTLYQLARAYDLSGQNRKSLATLSRLIKEYPNTQRKEEIEFRRGELYFQLKSYVAAARSYKIVMSNDDSQYYERAIYKYGWSLYKQNKITAALDSFYELLDYSFRGGKTYENLGKGKQSLLDDTFRIISLTFSYKKGFASIKSYTSKHGRRTYDDQIYRRLGDLYLEQSRYEDAAKTYDAYVELYPNDRYSPRFLLKVIDIYEQGGFAKSLTRAKGDFVNRYGIGKPYWVNHGDALLEELNPHIKKNLIELAKHFHAKGQRSKKPSDYKVAAHWYREYVTSFPAEPEAADMNFLLAESLAESGEYAKAAQEYENTAYKYISGSRSAEAAYAAILNHRKQIKAIEGEDLKMDKRRQAVDSSLRFTEAFPLDKRVPAVLLKTSEELLDFKQLADASLVANQLVALEAPQIPPKDFTKMKLAALAIIAASEFELGNLKKAEMATINRLRIAPSTDKSRKVHLDRLAAAVYKQGEAARDAGDYEAAADHFLRIGNLAPKSDIRVTAEYDAAAMYIKLEAWDRVIPVLREFVTKHPKHKLIQSANQQLAFAYEKTENWVEAAAMFNQLSLFETDPAKQRDLLWQTAQLFEKSNHSEDVIATYKDYIKNYPKPAEQAIEARIKIADIYKEQGQVAKRNYWLKQIIKADKNAQSTARTTYLAASASLELAEPTFISFQKVQLVQPLKKNLKKKKKLLKASVDAFTAAASYGVSEITTASTFRIAEIYNGFSKGLYTSERPKGLSADELEQYDLLLEDQAYPFEEKAMEIHETNANRISTGLYDEWVKQSMEVLKVLSPVRYAKNERSDAYLSILN